MKSVYFSLINKNFHAYQYKIIFIFILLLLFSIFESVSFTSFFGILIFSIYGDGIKSSNKLYKLFQDSNLISTTSLNEQIIIFVLLTIVIFEIAILSANSYLTLYFRSFLTRKLQKIILIKIFNRSWKRLRNLSPSSFSFILLSSVNTFWDYTDKFIKHIQLVLKSLAMFIILSCLSLKLSIILIPSIIFLNTSILYLKKMLKNQRKGSISLNINISDEISNVFDSMKSLKAMGLENSYTSVMREKLKNFNKNQTISMKYENLNKIFLEFFIYGFLCLFIWIIPNYSSLSGNYIALYLMVLLKFMLNINNLISNNISMSVNDIEIEKISSFLNEDESFLKEGGVFKNIFNEIKFAHVSFNYENKEILKNINFSIKPGEVTLLKGPSGAGKTTLIDMIARLNEPRSGQIFVDDSLLNDINETSWRKNIGYVQQENILLDDTVMGNITLGSKLFSESDVTQALKQAGAWSFVEVLPLGINTKLGRHGNRISLGQRQRIILARALINNPKILILDEVTSALDEESRNLIRNTLQKIKKDKIIIVVTHRSDMDNIADKVLYLCDGVIIENPDKHKCEKNFHNNNDKQLMATIY